MRKKTQKRAINGQEICLKKERKKRNYSNYREFFIEEEFKKHLGVSLKVLFLFFSGFSFVLQRHQLGSLFISLYVLGSLIERRLQ